jgi:hypothetical protein
MIFVILLRFVLNMRKKMNYWKSAPSALVIHDSFLYSCSSFVKVHDFFFWESLESLSLSASLLGIRIPSHYWEMRLSYS